VTVRRPLVVAAEVGLAAVTLAAVLGMSRLFDGGGWLGPLAANAVAAHLVVAVLRRRGVSLPAAAALMVVAAAFVATWTSYWSTTVSGIPTGDTWTAMRGDLDHAWTIYQDVVAPAPVETGFVLASCFALWVVAYIADWAAFRLWVPFEATLPAGTLFLFTALLGAERGRGWAVALYAGALLGFLLLHRMARQDGSSHWVADRRALGHRSLLTAGVGLGLVAVVTGSVLGPSFPGADSPGVLDPRDLRGDDSRVTISPLVDIRSRLVDQSAVEVFTVQSPVRSYWRLTSLERFNGRIWSSSGSYGKADGDLPEAVPTELGTETFEQTVTISALAAIWLPSAYEPRAVAAEDVDVRYDEDSATLIVDNDVANSDGLVYQVTSASPRISAEDLAGTADEVPQGIRDRFLGLPDDFSPQVALLARQVTGGAGTPAQKARALQDHLRAFEYSLEVQPGHSENALENFLFTTRTGYCEQFAGAFAAMARSVGIPARVAVGFTPGDEDPDQPGLYHVRGEYAHAWPEVFIAGAGWVAYEPTPGRGAPNAESYTGVREQQAAPSNPGGTVTVPPTTGGQTIPTGPSTSLDIRDPDRGVTAGGGGDEGSGSDSAPVRLVLKPLARIAPIVVGLLLAYALLFPLGLLLRRALRRRRATTPLEQIELAWSESAEHAALVGFHERPSDTYFERAHHLSAALPEAETAAFALAGRLEAGTYSAEGADEEDVEVALAAAEEIRAATQEQAPLIVRVRRWFDPRSLVQGWRREHTARQRRITLTARGDLEQERELVGSSDRG
jgi:transglutaminase-like putative cysteine protease